MKLRESSLGAVVTPLQQTYTLMPCTATVRNAGHVLHLLTEVHSWSPPHLVLTHPVDYGWVAEQKRLIFIYGSPPLNLRMQLFMKAKNVMV